MLGGGTLFISVPKRWVIANGLKKGDTIGIDETPSGSLLVSVEPSAPSASSIATLKAYGEDPMYVKREVAAAYLSGMDQIKVEVEPKAFKTRKIIRDVAKDFLGLELIDQDVGSLTFRFMFDTETMTPFRIFSRMNTLSRSIYTDITEALGDQDLLNDILDRDAEIDRLFFLGVRILRQAAANPAIAAKLGLSGVKALDYRIAFHHLEYLGDMAHRLAELISQSYKKAEDIWQLKMVLGEIASLHDSAYNYFTGAKTEPYMTFLDSALRVYEHIEILPEELALKEVKMTLREIHRLIVDIADLASTLYPYVK